MKPCRLEATSRQRRAPAKSLSLALITLVALHSAMTAASREAVATRKSGADAAASPPVQAGFLFAVNTTGDGDRVSGGAICDADAATPGEQCTLRAAIQAANDNTGTDSIGFHIPASDPGCDAATGRCVIKLREALPDISTDMAINGPGADKLTVRREPLVSGQFENLFRIFNVTTAGAATLSGMTISNGYANGGLSGGGVLNFGGGTLTVSACDVSDNVATYSGGGIENRDGTINVVNSTIARNAVRSPSTNCCANAYGGGISNSFSGTLNVTNSTITGNSAVGAPSYNNHDPNNPIVLGPGSGYGGGIYNGSGVSNVTNCTVSGNLATANPNGDSGVGEGHGGGVRNDTGSFNLKSTISANNSAATSGKDISGNLTSHGYNLFESPFGATYSQQQTDIVTEDPKLGPLQMNGGHTPTMALLAGSPAIDQASANGLTGPLSTDQRGAGFARTVDDPSIPDAAGGDGTDIGAFELKPTVQFSSAAYSVNEGTATATITVRRTGSVGQAVTVRYATADGTATAGKDYTAKTGTLSFASGEANKTFTVAITNDTLDEADETLKLTLSNPTGGAALGTPNTALLKIVDNDSPPTLSITGAALTEGNTGTLNATFDVNLSAASGKTITVKYVTADGTADAPADYAVKAGTVTFAPGQTSRPVTVTVRGDLLDEATETFFVNLSAPVNASIADNQGQGTIMDNDPTPALTINDRTVTEVDSGAFNVTLTVKLSAVSGQTVTVKYTTVNGTASSASDYVAKTGTLIFAPGQTVKPLVVAVRGDTLPEVAETFFVNLSAQTNATLADGQSKLTILNDD